MKPAPVLLFLLLASTVPAAAQVQKSFPFDRDPRLAKPVAAHWKKSTLAGALREIADATHVRLVADRGGENEPLMAAATPLPARDLLAQIARLTHFSWRRYGGTAAAPGYMIYQD